MNENDVDVTGADDGVLTADGRTDGNNNDINDVPGNNGADVVVAAAGVAGDDDGCNDGDTRAAGIDDGAELDVVATGVRNGIPG